MLQNSFIHFKRISKKKEMLLWKNGILTWNDFIKKDLSRLFPPERITELKDFARESEYRLTNLDIDFFKEHLPEDEKWRLYPHFINDTAFIDIETTGTGGGLDHITTIAMYGKGKIYHYIFGVDLEKFLDDIKEFKLIVTFNGKCFDIPFIQRSFAVKINQAHVDLRFVLKSVGYKGGLKKCEEALGISRGSLKGVDGYYAVLLWREYTNYNKKNALETLLAYNIEDSVNLKHLMICAYNKKVINLGFGANVLSEEREFIEKPFKSDDNLIEDIRKRYFSY